MKKMTSQTLLFVSVAIVVAVTAGGLLDRLFAPWAFESDARPALTGGWVGSLVTATGRPRGVQLDLRLPPPKGRGGLVRDWENAPHGELGGTARICDECGLVRGYTVDGEPEDRRASRMRFHLAPAETPAPEGLTPDWVSGLWDRADRLDLRVAFHLRHDGGAISGSENPDTQQDAKLALTRGDDAAFQALCARLARSDADAAQ